MNKPILKSVLTSHCMSQAPLKIKVLVLRAHSDKSIGFPVVGLIILL